MRKCLSGQRRTWGLMCSKTYSLKKKREETMSTRARHVLHMRPLLLPTALQIQISYNLNSDKEDSLKNIQFHLPNT